MGRILLPNRADILPKSTDDTQSRQSGPPAPIGPMTPNNPQLASPSRGYRRRITAPTHDSADMSPSTAAVADRPTRREHHEVRLSD
jgi:hypothetical protein